MRPELEPILNAAQILSREELPRLLGELEEVRATALARLHTPIPAPQVQPDELLSIEAASRKLGVGRDYLYRHHGKMPFTRRIGRKLLFSSRGIEAYIARKTL